jgi:hypothetical protein
MRMTTACGVVLHIMCQTGGCVLDYSHFGDEAEICCCQPHVFVVSECSRVDAASKYIYVSNSLCDQVPTPSFKLPDARGTR